MADFVLLGNDSDETRLLVERTSGYSAPLPAFPKVSSRLNGLPAWDIAIDHRDVQASYAFKLDVVEDSSTPQVTASSLLASYAQERAREGFVVRPMPVAAPLRSGSSVAGAELLYPSRGSAELFHEHLWLSLRRYDGRIWALTRLTRYQPSKLYTIKWHHLRTSFSAHHHWDHEHPRTEVPMLWPESLITRPAGDLDLTDDAWLEAKAKAADLGTLDSAQIKTLVEILTNVVEEDFPPALRVPEVLSQLHVRRIREVGPSGNVLTRNVSLCETAHDFRGWAWQCAWANMNRGSFSG